MWTDAFTAPYLCTDATGVLVQARERCRRGHFWVVIAPERHVLFGYTARHDSAAVDGLLKGYEGYLVADAHAVFDHLYRRGTLVEVACWAHLRRYWFKALTTDPERARKALAFIGGLFRGERAWATAPPEERLRARRAESKPIVDAFFAWCDEEVVRALDETPTAKAIGYARNQRVALQRFLEDGRLPIHSPEAATVRYRSTSRRGPDHAWFVHRFASDTELTGSMTLNLWVSTSDGDDLDLFVVVHARTRGRRGALLRIQRFREGRRGQGVVACLSSRDGRSEKPSRPAVAHPSSTSAGDARRDRPSGD